MTKNTKLTYLYLDLPNNKISNDGAKIIANALKTNTTLVMLGLNKNTITKKGLLSIYQALKANKNTKLQLLYINNKFININGSTLDNLIKELTPQVEAFSQTNNKNNNIIIVSIILLLVIIAILTIILLK